MSDESTGASGNRWEPPADQAETETQPHRSWLTRARLAVAGAAVGVLVAGGVGGFAVGRATAEDGHGQGYSERQGVPSGFDRDGQGFHGGPGPGSDDGDDGSNGSTGNGSNGSTDSPDT